MASRLHSSTGIYQVKLHTILSMPYTVLQALGGHADGVNINTIQTAINKTVVLLC